MASETFTAANGTNVSTLSNWNVGNGDIIVTTNAARANTGGSGPHYWYTGTFANDQYAEVTYSDATNTHGQIGPSVRKSANTTITLYGFEIFSTGSEFYKRVSGTYTALGAGGGFDTFTLANGDVFRLEGSGSTITPKKNGATAAQGAVTDSSIASGQPGLGGWSDGSGSVGADTWEGGDLSSGVTGTLSVTLNAVTAASAGTVDVAGTVSVTLAAVTSAAAGTVDVVGTASVTLTDVTSSAAGTVDVVGTLSKTLDDVTLSAAGSGTDTGIGGDVTQTLDAVTVSAAGTVAVQGASDLTLEAVTSTAAGTVALSGVVTVTLEAVVGTLAGAVDVQGSLSVTLADVTLTSVQTPPWVYGDLVRLVNVSASAPSLANVRAVAPSLTDVVAA